MIYLIDNNVCLIYSPATAPRPDPHALRPVGLQPALAQAVSKLSAQGDMALIISRTATR